MNIEKMRAEFESRFPIPEGAYWGEGVNQYCATELADSFSCNYWMLWEAWQASRESLVVELPKRDPLELSINAMFGYDLAQKEAIKAIHAAGVKTK